MERKYKDSGIEWIGRIPEDWSLSRLKSVLRSPIETGKRPNEPEGKILSIGGEHIQNGCFDLSHPMYVSETTYSENKGKIQLYDTLVVKDGATIGKCMYVTNLPGEKMLLNEHVYRISCSKFYYYWILSEIAQKWFRVRNQSTAQESITGPTIMNLPIIVSSKTEQQHIADYLDGKCGEIDSLIALQEQMIEKLKAYKQSVITEAVTKGLDPNAKLVPSGIDWIKEIPEGWKVLPVKRMCQNITDGSHFSPNTAGEGKAYITVSNVYNDEVHVDEAAKISIDDFSVLVANGCQPPIGSVLLAKDGTVGRTAVVQDNDYVVLSSLGILTPLGTVLSKYLKYLLDSDPLQAQMQLAMAGSALRRITITKICKLIGIQPPLSEQKAIITHLDDKCSDIDHLIALKQQKIESLKDYKKSVIYEAVTGKTIIE